MMHRGRHVVMCGVMVAAAVGCAKQLDFGLPTPDALDSCTTPPGHLRAGFGRADITPPPGPGLQGNGPDGRRSEGYRHRLYARAMVLQDSTGHVMAIVIADLPQVSAILQREMVNPTRLPARYP